MKHAIFRMIILLFLLLGLIAAGVNARANDDIEIAGKVLTMTLPAAAAGLTLGLKDGEGAWQLGKSTALTLAVSYGLKYTINETRPDGGQHSFPSNHASVSFSAAEFIRHRYGWKFGVPAYVAATFAAYSRVESKRHYAHDVIAGAVIGIGSSYLFTQPYNGWQIYPDIDGAYYGIRLSRTW